MPRLFLLASLTAGFFGAHQSLEAQTCRAPKPTICDRDCWNARAPQCSISQMGSLTRAVVHHTASTGDYNTSGLTDSKSRMRSNQNYHMDVNGWCDIGYHFLVDKHGNIFSGRSGSAVIGDRPQGAHDGCNDNSFGFTALGYYHPPYNNAVTTALLNGLEKAIAWRMPTGWSAGDKDLNDPYCGVSIGDAILGHRQVKATACPGDGLYNKIKDGNGFENAIAARRSCN